MGGSRVDQHQNLMAPIVSRDGRCRSAVDIFYTGIGAIPD
jgi:hypothetical protein